MSKSPRKPNPATVRKAAAVEAYTKEYGRAPVGRMSAARMEKQVWNAQQTKIRIDNDIKAMSRPAAAPAAPARAQPSFKALRGPPTPVPMPVYPPPQSPAASRLAGASRYATPALLGVSVGAAAVQGYHRSRDHGDSVGVAAAKGAVSALPAAFVAGAPQIERGAAKFATAAFEIGDSLVKNSGMLDFFLGWPLLKIGGASILSGVVAKGVEKIAQVAGKAALPAALAAGAVTGAMRDENRLRGAGRGMVSALDPTALFMNKGLAERGFNAVFGEQDRPLSQQPRMNQQNPATDDYRGKGGLTRHSEARLSAPVHFAAANESFRAGRVKEAEKAEASGNHARGFQNPQNLYAALRARNASTDNVANF